jgi:hypothetical protein
VWNNLTIDPTENLAIKFPIVLGRIMKHAARILIVAVLLSASGLHAQIYTILHSFPAFSRDG